MKKFTQTTLIALLIGNFVFAQKGSPGNQVAPSQTTVIVGALRGNVILLSPTDGKSIAASDVSKPVLFRWTALVPKPKETVTYRLKVWQLMQGQNSSEAMRSNQPVVTKDVVNITQAAISNLYTGPCKPPYLCDFVWAVEVINSDEIATGKIYAASQEYSFKFNVAANVPAGLATADNKSSVGSTGMSGGKSLNADGDSTYKYKTYQPGKPIYGNVYQSSDVESEVYSFEYGPKAPKDVATGQSSGKSLNFQGDSIPVVNINGLPPGQPVIIGGGTKAQGDPIYGVDVKPGVNSKIQGDGVHGVVVKRGIKAVKN